VPSLKRCVKLAHAVPLLGDQVGIDGPVRTTEQRCGRAVIAIGINPVDALVLNAADARTEAQAQHTEGGKIELGVAVGIGVMAINAQPLEKVKLATLPDSYSLAQS
jgi:hypothetical protein